MTKLPLGALRFSKKCWPRFVLDAVRVVLFTALMAEGVDLEPIVVIPLGDGTFLIADGVHRWQAALKADLKEIPVVVLNPMTAETIEQCAYRVALETSTRSALPLTGAERRRAVLQLVETRSNLSHREIAKLLGVAHSTVDRWVREAQASQTESDSGESTPTSIIGPNSDQIAKRIATYLGQLDEARGLFDMLAPSRMGKHLAHALHDRFDDGAVAQAERFADWIAGAVAQLKAQG